MTIKKCFPTFIYYAPLTASFRAKFNRELLKESYQLSQADEEGEEWSKDNYPGGYTSYSSLSDLHKRSSTFAQLEGLLTKHAHRYLKALEYNVSAKELGMTSCWVNIVPPGHSHSLHLHPLSLISGTYYVETPPGSGSLKFEDPRLSKFMATPGKRPGASWENQQYLHFKPKRGYVVLFESWLRHEVEKNLGRKDRVSISFNFNWF
jgi:uncharacterized protein (TIGR02466 family)